jgi:hypothetical protein
MTSRNRLRHLRWAAVVGLGVIFVALRAAPGTFAAGGFDICSPSQVHLTITRVQNAFTGGSYPVLVKLRNVARSECSVEGTRWL